MVLHLERERHSRLLAEAEERFVAPPRRAQYPLVQKYALNYKGPYILIKAIFLN